MLEENKYLKEQLKIFKNELIQTNEGLLILEKNSLESTLKLLSEEVFY